MAKAYHFLCRLYRYWIMSITSISWTYLNLVTGNYCV